MPGPISRRGFLQVGLLGVGGLSLAEALRMRAEAGEENPTPDTSFIFISLPGGAPQMEMYDLKPDAPAEYRGEFKPIKTNVPGIDVCELMPRHAKIADKFALLRTVTAVSNDHLLAGKYLITGKPAGGSLVNTHPAIGSIVNKFRRHIHRGVPNYNMIVDQGREHIDAYAMGSAYLGPTHYPFIIGGDPNDPNFRVQNLEISADMEGRLDDRATLLQGLDKLRRDVDTTGRMAGMDQFNQTAFGLLTDGNARKAFDLSAEPDSVRDRYGRHHWGQQTLMARRLVEAGASYVTVVLETPGRQADRGKWPAGLCANWDLHAPLGHLFDDCRIRLPMYDQAIASLIEDIYDRGLDKKVMLMVTGEFGRTPKIVSAVGTRSKVTQPGRDHWHHTMSVLFAGGGLTTGQVVGKTDRKGEYPVDRKVKPTDLWATVYRHLGIDPTWTITDRTGRPLPLMDPGDVIPELLSVVKT